MEFCQNCWESGILKHLSIAHLLISEGMKLIKLKAAALAVTSGVIVEDQRKDK